MKIIVIRHSLYASLALFIACFVYGCNGHNHTDSEDAKYELTDYSKADNWLFVSGDDPACEVDVFFVYPTAYTGGEEFCAVTDTSMRTRALAMRESQASVYEETANLYMPYYRQLNATFALTLDDAGQDRWMREVPAADVIAAFRYYYDKYNRGKRPFLLAGHSQGSNTLLYLLEYLKDKTEIAELIVAAYVIGYSVTPEFLDEQSPLPFASGRTDTQVIVSWNTEAPGVSDANPVLLKGALCINPVNWVTDATYAGREESIGARLEVTSGVFESVKHLADAKVNTERGVVECSTVNKDDYQLPPPFPNGSLHSVDYALYYYDLQQNVKERTDIFLSGRKSF